MVSTPKRIFLIPLIAVLILLTSVTMMLVVGYRTWDEAINIFIPRMGLILINSAFTVTVFYFAISWFNKKILWDKNWAIRLLLDFILVFIHAMIGTMMLNYFFEHGIMGNVNRFLSKDFMYVMPLTIDTLFLVLIEFFMHMEEKSKLALQVAHLEKEQLNAKYAALKTQLDHHFLFNNLSVLSSIIYEDVHKADKFIQRFSQVYRYVLSINKRDLIKLEEELEFIESYLQLYKFRFEEGIDYKINIDETKKKMQIAPLTLQVLVENAIKHNVVSQTHPLQINIYNKNNLLIVDNNLQIRNKSDIDSTNTGHNNIIQKYELLNLNKPVICNNGKTYSVEITLIPQQND